MLRPARRWVEDRVGRLGVIAAHLPTGRDLRAVYLAEDTTDLVV
jgi:hypothetical protein